MHKHLFFLFLLPLVSKAQQPTWAADVAPILYKHCVSCHRVDGVGGFTLETWTDAQNAAEGMLTAVQSRYMPPWRADPAYRHFKDENYLSDTDIATIEAWVNGAQLPGDLSQAPPLPNFQNGSQLTAVDLVLETPPYTVAQNTDEYRAFAIPTNFSTTKYFNEIEIVPGNDAIIHHIVLYVDPTDEPLQKDLADPGPGFKTNGMVGSITDNAELIGEWTPGGTPIKLPPQFGYKIPPNGYFIMEIHFAPGHLGATDEGSQINLKLTDHTPIRELYYGVLAYGDTWGGLVNPPFKIPANTEHKLIAELKVSDLSPLPLSLFSLTPHAHVLGKSFKAYSYRVGQTDTIPLVNVPRWDFFWQGTYTLQKPVKLNTNRRCRAEVVYDNTTNNPLNPNNPPKDVFWGENTSDEMLYLFATVALYQNGDENLVLDSMLFVSTPSVQVEDETLQIMPNPISEVLEIRAKAPLPGMSDLSLMDMSGRVLRQWREQDLHRSRTAVRDLPPGVYTLLVQHAGRSKTYKVVKDN
jgi:hypothetical protein